MSRHGLAERVAARLSTLDLDPAAPLVVACSGGVDSLVLGHVLRFGIGTRPDRWVWAHFDHAMREESRADAAWVGGVGRAWGVPVIVARASQPPANEGDARALRWRFLEEVAREHGASAVLTAHHDDDQAETVLHRAMRGTGLRGLGGMELEAEGRVRPLLGERRSTLESYAEAVGLRPRVDPTNALPVTLRNRLRHEVLPLLEAVRPGAAAGLVRLAALARADERALAQAEDLWLEVHRERAGGALRLDLGAVRALRPEFRARVLRRVARDTGVRLDAAGTRAAVQFTTAGPGAAECRLPGGLVLRRSLGTLEFDVERSEEVEDRDLWVPNADPGQGGAIVGGARWTVRWGPRPQPGALRVGLDLSTSRFPLRVRAWRPGDRIEGTASGRTVSRAWARAGVPAPERRRRPVVEDRRARLVWVPGAPGPWSADEGCERCFFIGMDHVDHV